MLWRYSPLLSLSISDFSNQLSKRMKSLKIVQISGLVVSSSGFSSILSILQYTKIKIIIHLILSLKKKYIKFVVKSLLSNQTKLELKRKTVQKLSLLQFRRRFFNQCVKLKSFLLLKNMMIRNDDNFKVLILASAYLREIRQSVT